MHSTTTIPMLCREVLCRPIVYQANSEKRGRQGRPRTKYLSPPPHPLLQYYLLEKIRNGVQPIDTIVTLYSDRTHSTLEADSAFSGLASEGCAVRRTFFFLLARAAQFILAHACAMGRARRRKKLVPIPMCLQISRVDLICRES